jgi:hypothetical protein
MTDDPRRTEFALTYSEIAPAHLAAGLTYAQMAAIEKLAWEMWKAARPLPACPPERQAHCPALHNSIPPAGFPPRGESPFVPP